MTQERFADMSDAEFDELINSYIERTASGYGEMPAEFFLDLLTERIAAKTEETLNLSVDVLDDELVITPDRETGDIVVRGNEILVGNRRLVLRLIEREGEA